MFFDEETKSVLESSEFSEIITLITNEYEIETAGLFDLTYMEVDPSTGAKIMIDSPRASLYENEIKELVGEILDGWHIRCRGVRYRIVEPQPDGTGMIHLKLKKA